MKAIEFKGSVASDGRIALPADVASQVPAGEPVQVVLLWGRQDEESAWLSMGRRAFEDAYGPEDSIYEQLADEASTR